MEIIYFDEVSKCELHSYYTVFYDSDTIVRYIKFINCGKQTLYLRQAIACQLDFQDHDYSAVTLCGEYGHERQIDESPLRVGIQRIYSKRGQSSHWFNPFMALK